MTSKVESHCACAEAGRRAASFRALRVLSQQPTTYCMCITAAHCSRVQGLQLYDKLFDGHFTEDLKASGGNFCNSLESGIIHHPNSGVPSCMHPGHHAWTEEMQQKYHLICAHCCVCCCCPPPRLRLSSTGVLPWKVHVPPNQVITIGFCSRHLFESTTRKLVTASPKVHFLYGTTVASLVFGGGEVACGAGDKPVDVKTVTGGAAAVSTTATTARPSGCHSLKQQEHPWPNVCTSAVLCSCRSILQASVAAAPT